MSRDVTCAGCYVHLDSDSKIASIDYPPGDPGHDNDARYWRDECLVAHQDGHPGDPNMQRRCSPEVCPTYNGGWR